jgi:hypothetical protein
MVIVDNLREATALERQFFGGLASHVPDLQDWYHQDPDGEPWMTVSYDFIAPRGGIAATLRLDYDGTEVVGGWSPAGLNWDDGVRARDARVDTTPPGGLAATARSPEEACAIALPWLQAHLSRWPGRES